jgi:hypothetical protein
LWDAARTRAAMQEAGSTLRWTVLPEQVFLSGPADGSCLREAGTALVLERWIAGTLAFSACLPAGNTDPGLWLRAAGLPIDSALPRVPARHSALRWDERPLDWRVLSRDPLAAAGVFAVAMSLWLMWSIGELAGWKVANQRLEDSLAAEQRALAPRLAEREKAMRLAGDNHALAREFGGVTGLDAVAEFEFLVGDRFTRLLDWQFDGRKLRVTLEDDAPDNRAYVEALDRSPWFDNVRVAPSMRANQIVLEIAVVSGAEKSPVHLVGNAGDAS